MASPGCAAFSSAWINRSSLSISSQLPKMSSPTVGMWLDDEAFGCWTLGVGISLDWWPLFGKLFTFGTPFGRGAPFCTGITFGSGAANEDIEVDEDAPGVERSPWLEIKLPSIVFPSFFPSFFSSRATFPGRLPPRRPVRLLAKLLTRCTPTFQIRLARSVANTTKTV